MNDPLGDRMKGNYEDRTRFSLPRRTYTIIRLDGKAFHTYTKGLDKPFDQGLSDDIDTAIKAIMPQIQGAVFAYTQSDEISILVTDFALPTTDAWFDGNLQKMCSVSASLMTAQFNQARVLRKVYSKEPIEHINGMELAYFDARIFTIPDPTEVMNYFIWRNNDCARNSLSMVAQDKFSHTELQGKGGTELHEMLHAKGVNWANDYTDDQKNGRLIVKEKYVATRKELNIPEGVNYIIPTEELFRHRWTKISAWKFTEEKHRLRDMIPQYT
jgi:tRNA(His) guanylyltransferase